jgi:endonuclease YncB( thermonuclease family)
MAPCPAFGFMRVRPCIAASAFALVQLGAGGVHAQTLAAAIAAPGCKLESLGTGTAATVVDARTLVLADGREVRLAAIEVAPPTDAAGAAAKTALESLTAGQTIELRGPAAETDRYGRLVAHLFVVRDGKERWLQAELIERGHARVAARIGERACAAALLAHEQKARGAKLGLWGEPGYGVRRAEDATGLTAERGRFAIVEGKVLSVRESGGTIYVNFGRRWTQDFTVTISKRNERIFADAGLEPKRLEGRRVRIRGWIEQRGGPWVEATRPEQIELAER